LGEWLEGGVAGIAEGRRGGGGKGRRNYAEIIEHGHGEAENQAKKRAACIRRAFQDMKL